jgi:hypothetical protein
MNEAADGRAICKSEKPIHTSNQKAKTHGEWSMPAADAYSPLMMTLSVHSPVSFNPTSRTNRTANMTSCTTSRVEANKERKEDGGEKRGS